MLTANFRSFSLIGLQIGSPSRLTITAGVLLKKIVGGSALTPSTFFGTIWLLSTLARTRSSAITRSSSGWPSRSAPRPRDAAPSASVGKLASAIFRFLKLTRRSSSGHLGVGFELDRAQRRLLGPLRLDATRR